MDEESEAPAACDVLGRELEPGMVITYPGRFSSSLWINIGIVRMVNTATPHLEVERLEVTTSYGHWDDTLKKLIQYQTPQKTLHRKLVRLERFDRATITGLTEDEAVAAVTAERKRRV